MKVKQVLQTLLLMQTLMTTCLHMHNNNLMVINCLNVPGASTFRIAKNIAKAMAKETLSQGKNFFKKPMKAVNDVITKGSLTMMDEMNKVEKLAEEAAAKVA